jgi:GNAT superfamily N-acetyltransferase
VAALTLRAARPDELPALSELALRSKAHWGYDDAFLEACRAELTVHGDDLASGVVVVAEVDGTVAGFSRLTGPDGDGIGEADMLFVAPEHIGHGIGHALFTRLRDDAVARGCRALRIEADPNAAAFYAREGAVRVGEVPSASIAGRALPLLDLDLGTRGSSTGRSSSQTRR